METEKSLQKSTAGDIALDNGQGIVRSQIQFEPLDASRPLVEKILHADAFAWSLAKCSAAVIIYAGNLLRDQQKIIDQEAPGTWDEWVKKNLKGISKGTVKNYIRASVFAEANDGIELVSISDLYRACGVLKKDAPDICSDPPDIESILKPAEKVIKDFRLIYDDKTINKLNPIVVPQFLGIVRQIKGEMIEMETKIVKKYGDKPVIPV